MDGIRGFYKGVLTTLMRDIPWSGLQYASYKYGIDMYKSFNPEMKTKESPLIVSAIAAASSCFAVTLTYPFDNLRVRFQCHDLADKEFRHPLDLIKTVIKEEGFKGLYVGLFPRLIKKGVSSVLTWLLYETLRKDSVLHSK